MNYGLAVFGMFFGVLSILDGIFEWGLVRIIRPASKTEIKISEIIIGLIFIALAILVFAGVF
jgi:hypothetical protein